MFCTVLKKELGKFFPVVITAKKKEAS